MNIVYKIPYRRARTWPIARASKGILQSSMNREYGKGVSSYVLYERIQ